MVADGTSGLTIAQSPKAKPEPQEDEDELFLDPSLRAAVQSASFEGDDDCCENGYSSEGGKVRNCIEIGH
jgi:hypothetical protein